uniref:Auxin-responsive protein n=1 Tax=Oryza punctata TaxID=4537 RepID=A0A0E0M434_ORYPU
MIHAKKLAQLAKKLQQRMVSAGGSRQKAATADDCCSTASSSLAGKGHCAVYTADGARFEVPLPYLGTPLIGELLTMSQEEFGFASDDGRITLPCDASVMEYVMCLLNREASEEVERAFLSSIARTYHNVGVISHQLAGMGKMPKDSLLRHTYDHLGPGPGIVVEHAVVPFLPNGPHVKGHDRVKPTTTLSRNFESARAVPLVERDNTRGEEMREAETREDERLGVLDRLPRPPQVGLHAAGGGAAEVVVGVDVAVLEREDGGAGRRGAGLRGDGVLLAVEGEARDDVAVLEDGGGVAGDEVDDSEMH